MSSLLERAKSFPRGAEIIAGWLGSGANVVDGATAQRRADICLGCKANVKANLFTETVAEMIKRSVGLKNHLGLRVNGEKKLGECSVCLCSLKTKVHVPGELIQKHKLQGEDELFEIANPKCWQLNP